MRNHPLAPWSNAGQLEPCLQKSERMTITTLEMTLPGHPGSLQPSFCPCS